jgi:hypothetical protein
MAFESTADVIGFGGAAGGGKTDLAMGKALRQHERVAVFRQNGTEHTAFIDRIQELIETRDGFNGQTGIWRINHTKAKVNLELCSIPNMGDEAKYRGRPHDLCVFDECAQIPEFQVRFLMGWNRTTTPGQKCQSLLCFNPPSNAEGRWVIRYFAPWLDPKHPKPAQPGELRYFATIVKGGRPVEVEVDSPEPFIDGAELITPQSRTFIPSRVTDNPHLMGTNYMTQLQALPEPLRSQMLYGDFQAGMEDDAMQVVPTAWVEAAMARWQPKDVKPEMDCMGVDVARGGKDNTIMARRHGWWFDEPIVYQGATTPDGPSVAGKVVAALRDSAPIAIDVIGVGSSPYDFLRELRVQVLGVNVSEKSGATDQSGRMRFSNMRSQLWWQFRELLDPSNNKGVALPPDQQLKADLCAPTWRVQSNAIYIESREDIVKRIHRSPDWASAYVLAALEIVKLNKLAQPLDNSKREYDPYARRREHDPYK